MGKNCLTRRWRGLIGMLVICAAASAGIGSLGAEARAPYTIVDIQDKVLVAPAGSTIFKEAVKGQELKVGDRVRVGEKGFLLIQRGDYSTLSARPKSEFVIPPPKAANLSPAIRLLNGALYFLHRGKPGDVEVESPTTTAAVRGTEFNFEVSDNGTTVITVIDGIVDFRNEVAGITVQNGQQGVAEPGKAPELRAAIDAINVIQWTLYYPGILDADEIELADAERGALRASLEAYRSGDLLRAINEYPAGREAQSNAEKVYLAGLTLAVGKVEDAQKMLGELASNDASGSSRDARLAGALQQVIATVKMKAAAPTTAPELASEWLAESYRLQSQANLEGALKAARAAVEKSPNFAFGWARVAELEFGFGRIDAASEALSKSLQLAQRNAQAIALEGYLLAAQNKIDTALRLFDAAIEVDGRLANAWLGRGLMMIRKGRSAEGRENLMTAAALEPQRAALRSYLGKAWSDAGEKKLAEHELELAMQFDPRDPTAWLYSALLKEQQNRVNEAIRDLEKSQDLNDNRAIYRSDFLLDQDRAVRSANLALIYRDAGMTEWSVREAGKAVAEDYANYSAHLFLANSYDQLRDPNRINLRYEAVAESEFLMANILAPAGGGVLSPTVSQNEYSKLFERDKLGVSSFTEYLSRGAWTERGAQFGSYRNSSYLLEGLYRSDPGQRLNNDFEETELRLHLKQQLTPQDSIYFRAMRYEADAGDVLQYYDPTNAVPGLRTRELQEPTLHFGYHHVWQPGVHTLFLAGRLEDNLSINNPKQPAYFIIHPEGMDPVYAELIKADTRLRTEPEIYTAELQQIWQQGDHTVVIGGRFQSGKNDIRIFQNSPPEVLNSDIIGSFDPSVPLTDSSNRGNIEQASGYTYYTWQPFDPLRIVGGIAYESVSFPANRLAAPPHVERSESQFSPKAGVLWNITKRTTFRFAYDRSLRGTDLQQTYALEPTQLVGINRSFRSIAPEAIAGANPGAEIENLGLAIDQTFKTGTYVGLSGNLLNTKGDRLVQSFVYDGSGSFAAVNTTPNRFKYSEKSALAQVHQILGHGWSFGTAYKFTYSAYENAFTDIPPDGPFINGFSPQSDVSVTLHQVSLIATYRHRCGVFAQVGADWYGQSNHGYAPRIPTEDFWQLNALLGYRFSDPQIEVTVGLLNLTDKDYRLNPISLINELPRERTFATRLRITF